MKLLQSNASVRGSYTIIDMGVRVSHSGWEHERGAPHLTIFFELPLPKPMPSMGCPLT